MFDLIQYVFFFFKCNEEIFHRIQTPKLHTILAHKHALWVLIVISFLGSELKEPSGK